MKHYWLIRVGEQYLGPHEWCSTTKYAQRLSEEEARSAAREWKRKGLHVVIVEVYERVVR